MTKMNALLVVLSQPATALRGMGRRASVGVLSGVALVPLIASAGAGIDMARLGLAKTALQAAVDEAALAGAAAYQSAGQSTAATNAATTYFNRYAGTLGSLVTVGSVVATPGTGSNAQGLSSYTMTVTATATIGASLMAIVNMRSMGVQAQATAANPLVQPVVTVGSMGSNAADWNAAFMYPIPGGSNPDYNAVPTRAQSYEIGSNCSVLSANYSINSQCLTQPGGTVPTMQSFPAVTSTQKLGFILVNQRRGLDPAGTAYAGPNQYGSTVGSVQVLSTGPLSQNHGPAYNTDNSATLWNQFSGNTVTQPATHYSDANSAAASNCALQIQVVDPKSVPTAPPSSGSCFAPSDQASGSQYANLSCSQMAGRTFVYWWNDMSGGTDDKDYNDLYYTVRCVPGATSPNGGTFSANMTPNANLSVALVR